MYGFKDNSDLEVFLKKDADRRKLYPSEHIWQNIRSHLHRHSPRRWPELAIVGIAIFLLHTAGLLVFKPDYKVLSAPFNTEEDAASFANIVPGHQHLSGLFYPEMVTSYWPSFTSHQEMFGEWKSWKSYWRHIKALNK